MAPRKQAAVQRAKNTVRSKKAALAKARAAKLAKKTPMEVVSTPQQAEFSAGANSTIPVRESASKRKLSFYGAATHEKPDSNVLASVGLIDLNNLSTLVRQLGCEVCSNKLELSFEKRTGSVLMMSICCKNCDTTFSTSPTSKTLVETKHYEVNRRLVAAFLNVGLGYAGMESFCEAMGMDSMTNKTYNAHLNIIKMKTAAFSNDIKAGAVEKVRQLYGAQDNDEVVDITVSFDGSWHKRGHTSKHGLGVVIETTSGLAVDFHVMSTHCQQCSTTGKILSKKGQQAYSDWYKGHESECTINHSGSAGLMEVEAAKTMWLRSMSSGLRYTTFVSDGDCKTYNELQALAPYDVPIKKEECTNHVFKRLGTALRNLVSTESKFGNTLGGRKAGSLSQVKINLLQRHYKKAVSSRCSSTEELRKKIMATFNHASSTDENPQHGDCPTGLNSWCFWQRAVAHNLPPPTHKGKSNSYILEMVAKKIKPIFERLTADDLLERCLSGMTQNANESIHAKIWARCPKHVFLGRGRVEIGTALAVSELNCGSLGLSSFLFNIGCSVGNVSMLKGKKRDAKRIFKAEKKEGLEAKRRRKEIATAQVLAQQEYLRLEGGKSYDAGKF